jgi:16S rRNA A1518/A1519 N6-dimethyltransferase RsmA/KsgA/DIM1 with predicted DNA glycosylase/AP lyase activity
MMIMKGDQESPRHIVENCLEMAAGQVVLELGPGMGFATSNILSKDPSRVFAIEISKAFRNALEKNTTIVDAMKTGCLTIHGEDAVSMPFISDGSVDRVLGINVIYFLAPLVKYLKELFRVIKPGGLVVWIVKDVAKTFDKKIYVNTDWDICLVAMEEAGFVATCGEKQLSGSQEYIPLYGRKSSSRVIHVS